MNVVEGPDELFRNDEDARQWAEDSRACAEGYKQMCLPYGPADAFTCKVAYEDLKQLNEGVQVEFKNKERQGVHLLKMDIESPRPMGKIQGVLQVAGKIQGNEVAIKAIRERYAFPLAISLVVVLLFIVLLLL